MVIKISFVYSRRCFSNSMFWSAPLQQWTNFKINLFSSIRYSKVLQIFWYQISCRIRFKWKRFKKCITMLAKDMWIFTIIWQHFNQLSWRIIKVFLRIYFGVNKFIWCYWHTSGINSFQPKWVKRSMIQ